MRFKEFKPTKHDSRGLGLLDRQEWLVAPTTRNRDSDALERSNFFAALRMLGGESEGVEVHRFGHWGVGWFEVILVHPNRETDLELIQTKLENYLILDEEDFSNREWEEAAKAWENMDIADRMLVCRKKGVSLFAARRDYLPGNVDPTDIL